MNNSREYLVDVTMSVSVRVVAGSKKEALAKLQDALHGSEANLGPLHGEPIVAEINLGPMVVVEIDGEPT
jgi:hypothetical protein